MIICRNRDQNATLFSDIFPFFYFILFCFEIASQVAKTILKLCNWVWPQIPDPFTSACQIQACIITVQSGIVWLDIGGGVPWTNTKSMVWVTQLWTPTLSMVLKHVTEWDKNLHTLEQEVRGLSKTWRHLVNVPRVSNIPPLNCVLLRLGWQEF